MAKLKALLVKFYSHIRVIATISVYKTMFGSSLPPVVSGRIHVLLCFCVCLHIVMSNTCCAVFFLLVLIVSVLCLVCTILSVLICVFIAITESIPLLADCKSRGFHATPIVSASVLTWFIRYTYY